MVMGCDTVRVTTQRKMLSQTLEKHRKNIQTPSNFPAGFFPPHFRVKSSRLFVFIFIFRCYGLLREKAVPFPSKRN